MMIKPTEVRDAGEVGDGVEILVKKEKFGDGSLKLMLIKRYLPYSRSIHLKLLPVGDGSISLIGHVESHRLSTCFIHAPSR